jgi:hypothetical protein
LAFSVVTKQFPPAFVHCAHCLDGVDHQVQDDLLQFDPISLDRRQSLDEFRLRRAPFLAASARMNSIASRIAADLYAVPLARPLFREVAGRVNEGARPNAVPDDATKRLPDLIRIRTIQPSQSRLGVATIAATGCFTSWTIEATRQPIVPTWLACASSACISRPSSSHRRASTMSRPPKAWRTASATAF